MPSTPEKPIWQGDVQSSSEVDTMRHSTSHVLAQAVLALYPGTRLGIGPTIENGFYYDFDLLQPITDEDLPRIEAKMKEFIAQDLPIVRSELPREEALAFFRERGQNYKVEIIENLPDGKVSLYRQGDFVDLCRGPHLAGTGRIGAFKLLHTAGAYWRGDEKRKMLQRIYGTAFPAQKELDTHLHLLEEARRRDHRKLGRELDLFSIHEQVGAGLIHWHPKGAMVRMLMEDYWKRLHLRRGYQFAYTAHIASEELYRTSGHLEAFSKDMYAPLEIEGRPYRVRPMNCPGHIMIYRTAKRSYRELPLRLAELGTVYRFEKSGVLHGLMRVRGFTIDDSHIFVAPEQLPAELDAVFGLMKEFLHAFGFERFTVTLSTRPETSVGSDELWASAEGALRALLERTRTEHVLDEGGGAFYGPKISVEVRDALNRSWQCSTVQVDFNLPERFGIEYVGTDGAAHRPIMIHRALMGSIERFFGMLIEHYGGAFPAWLAPVQVRLATVHPDNEPYAEGVARRLEAAGVRVERGFSNDTLGYKVRDAQLMKVPYIAVIGKKEQANGTVRLRDRSGKDLGEIVPERLIERVGEGSPDRPEKEA
ncbi:MAG: threonine--tRNA ligase [Nitrospirae bacterium]|nr:threonine--tRNA ligase [Nitrospirota bacterium]